MKRILWTALLAVPLFAEPAQAQFPHHQPLPPMKLDGGLTLKFNLFGGGGVTQLGPWYQYWPMEAHFQSPAPLGGIGNTPAIMTLPPNFGQGSGHAHYGPPQAGGNQQQWMPPAPTPIPPGSPPSNAPVQRTGFQQVGYSYYGQAPSYWYGR